tara:strand:+ start:6288 stop:8204 length:1917 start_codon:yes stop_codon:yes gene_type:complete
LVSKKFRKSSDFQVNTKEPARFEQFLSSSFNPKFRFRQATVMSNRDPGKLSNRFFSKEQVQKDNARNFITQSRNEKIEWKEKGVNPITLNMPSKVYPYGGGLAPVRQMTKQELVTVYLGSRAVANIIMQDKIDKGKSVVRYEDAQVSRNRLIRGDIKDGENVPLLPYSVPIEKGESYKTGTFEEAVLKDKRWWNDNVPDLQFDTVRENQTELTDSQVNAVWKYIQPEINNRIGSALREQDIGRERLVPSIRGFEPEIKDSRGVFVRAKHGFDFDGNINSARNQELIVLLDQELKTLVKNKERIRQEFGERSPEFSSINDREKLIRQSIKTVREERILKPRWAAMQDDKKNDLETFEDVKRNQGVSSNVMRFWGGPYEIRDKLDTEERRDAVVKWNLDAQYNSLHLGHWETNYLNPELEPGMFAAPENIEYRTFGANSLYNDRILERMKTATGNKNLTVGDVEKAYVFGQFDPITYRPTSGREKEQFDTNVAISMINTQNSTQYRDALRAWNESGESKAKDSEGKEITSALYYTAPNENQKRLEENFAAPENRFSTSAQKTTRHSFARNISNSREQENDLLNAVQPLQKGLLEGPKAQSVEKGVREEKKIWGEYARVRGDSGLKDDDVNVITGEKRITF